MMDEKDNTPFIKKGIRALGRVFSRRRYREYELEATAIKAVPKITAKTVTALKKGVKVDKPITRKKVAATMAKQTAKTLKSPRVLAKTVKRNRKGARHAAIKAGRTRRRRVLPFRRARRLRV